MKEGCAIAEVIKELADAGGNSEMGSGQRRPRKHVCPVEGCPVTASVKKEDAGEFYIVTTDASGKETVGFCKNGWASQSITVA